MIDVAGIGDGGWASWDVRAQELVRRAKILIGGHRHLAAVPDDVSAERLAWPSPLRDGLPDLLDRVGDDGVVILASGDPLRSGVGSTLIELLGHERVRIHPSVSSDTLARARLGWSAESCDVVTTVGRDVNRILPFIAPGARFVVLCSDGESPAAVARVLIFAGAANAMMTAFWHLDGPDEGSRCATAESWGDERTPDLVVVGVEIGPNSSTESAARVGPAAGRPDTAFDHDGLITKRDARAGAIARLRPSAGALLWDLGGGSGAVGIEWCLAARDARSVVVERNAERAERIESNAGGFGVRERVETRVETTEGFLRDQRIGQPTAQRPDAIFFGGGISAGALDDAVACLRSGGRLVAHAVTVQSEMLLHAARARHGGEMTRVSVETLDHLGSFDGWKPARSVVSWCWIASNHPLAPTPREPEETS